MLSEILLLQSAEKGVGGEMKFKYGDEVRWVKGKRAEFFEKPRGIVISTDGEEYCEKGHKPPYHYRYEVEFIMTRPSAEQPGIKLERFVVCVMGIELEKVEE